MKRGPDFQVRLDVRDVLHAMENILESFNKQQLTDEQKALVAVAFPIILAQINSNWTVEEYCRLIKLNWNKIKDTVVYTAARKWK